MTNYQQVVDQIDLDIIKLLTEQPRMSVLDLSRRLSIARGTAQARINKMLRNGVIKDLAPTIDPAALGYPVSAFVTVEVEQRGFHDDLIQHFDDIAEVLEVHTITGEGDLLVRLVARSNYDLQRVIDLLNVHPAVLRTSTVIALQEQVSHRVLPLVQAAAQPAHTGGSSGQEPHKR